MPEKSLESLSIIGAIVISTVSVITAITRRIAKGEVYTYMRAVSECMAALLAGYLAFTAYPTIAETVPKWFTLPIAVSLAAHVGGRLFQEIEDTLIAKAKKILQ